MSHTRDQLRRHPAALFSAPALDLRDPDPNNPQDEDEDEDEDEGGGGSSSSCQSNTPTKEVVRCREIERDGRRLLQDPSSGSELQSRRLEESL